MSKPTSTRRSALLMLGASLIGPLIAGATAGAADKKVHHVAIQVDENDVAKINLTLNNASNVAQYYGEKGEQVEIEIVVYGPGLHMLREDTMTPGIRDRLKSFTQSLPDVVFAACENTRANMAKAEGKKTTDIPIIKGAKLVPSGVVRLMELQEQGWSLYPAVTIRGSRRDRRQPFFSALQGGEGGKCRTHLPDEVGDSAATGRASTASA